MDETQTSQDTILIAPPAKRPRSRRLLLVLVGILTLIGLLSIGTISSLEEQDRFCASCHMVPERTYYNRAQFALAGVIPLEDLASAHYVIPSSQQDPRDFRCIDCHRGNEGVIHRGTAITLGARDAAIYLLGQPDQAIEKTHIEVPQLLTDSCIKCHADSLLVVGFQNHFHNKLPAAQKLLLQGEALKLPDSIPADQVEIYQSVLDAGLTTIEETDLRCVDCHLAHIHKPGTELSSFLDLQNVVYPACERCHVTALGQPLGLTGAGTKESAPNQ